MIIEIEVDDHVNDEDKKAMEKVNINILGASSGGFELECTFEKPFLFGGDNAGSSYVIVRADFSDFEPGWDNSKELLRYKIPKQNSNDEGTKQMLDSVGSAGASGTAATSAALGANILMSGAMSQVWGMINGLQLFVHFPMFDIEFPMFAQAIVSQLITIASFDVLPTDDLFLAMGAPEEDEPEEGDLNYKAYNIGYESNILIVNLGTLFITLIVMLSCPICIFCTRPYKQKSRWLNRKHESIGPSLRGNMWIRFVMEAFLDISISGTINVFGLLASGEIPFDTTFNIINSVMLIVLYPICFIFPFAIVVFYLCHFAKWEDEEFENKYGAVFEGLRKGQRSSLLYPFVFSFRRALLVTVAIILSEHFFVQMLS